MRHSAGWNKSLQCQKFPFGWCQPGSVRWQAQARALGLACVAAQTRTGATPMLGRMWRPVARRAFKESAMPLRHAAAWIEHGAAHVIQFDADMSVDQPVKQHTRYTRQHGNQVREQHEFFSEVCEALSGIKAVLVVGHHEPEAAFRQYVSKHRPALALHIAGWEIVDHPTEAQVVQLARAFFVRRGEMAGTPRMR